MHPAAISIIIQIIIKRKTSLWHRMIYHTDTASENIIMKRIVPLFLALLMILLPVSVQSESSFAYETARAIGNFMETHYNITILIGPECENISTDTFSIGNKPKGRTPLRELLGVREYDLELQLIDDVFSVYPPGFFVHFHSEEAPKGLRVLLVDQLISDYGSLGGVATIADGYYNLFLPLAGFTHENIHHEIWHDMEFRIICDNPSTFDGWEDLNPQGFLYGTDPSAKEPFESQEDAGPWFVRRYATIHEEEDRATVFEAYMLKDTDWWENHPLIGKKLEKMLEAAEPVFGTLLDKDE